MCSSSWGTGCSRPSRSPDAGAGRGLRDRARCRGRGTGLRAGPERPCAPRPASRSMELDIALHLGDVTGATSAASDRLDFTVIGPAVNEASRIEALCAQHELNLLISQTFAQAATGPARRLVSIGRYVCAGCAARSRSTRWTGTERRARSRLRLEVGVARAPALASIGEPRALAIGRMQVPGPRQLVGERADLAHVGHARRSRAPPPFAARSGKRSKARHQIARPARKPLAPAR